MGGGHKRVRYSTDRLPSCFLGVFPTESSFRALSHIWDFSALHILTFFFVIFELKSRHLQCELFGIPGHFEECALTHQGKIETSWRNKSCSLWIRTWREAHRSEVVMNPKQVFLSVLLFGAAGLLLFMYLQVWIEEQHTGNVQTYGLLLNENRSGNLLLRKWW